MYKILSVENRKTFEIKLEEFAGPMQLLLDLIEKEELEITKVSLARVTDEYIKHMEAHEVPPEDLADFLMIAARLMYLKSCTILPIEQEIEYD
ncbi:TPA: hypothetical protein DCZ32_02410, partial [Candidatus Uhrbacteria bacterium]|nr:hypothetical protein [Candidatus Uhrbacteria bacterium]